MRSKKAITASDLAARLYCAEARRLEIGGAVSANQAQMREGTRKHNAWRSHDISTAGSLALSKTGMLLAFGLLLAAIFWSWLVNQ